MNQTIKNKNLEFAIKQVNIVNNIQIEIDKYLQRSQKIEISVGERLRQLAIYLEGELTFKYSLKKSWEILDIVYSKAIISEPDNGKILQSKGLSSYFYLTYSEDEQSKSFFTEISKEAYYLALKIIPNDPDLYYEIGLLYYFVGNLNKAIRWFKKCIKLDSDHPSALMYIGHCYDDLNKPEKALSYYLKVNVNRLTDEMPIWRKAKLWELIGYIFLVLEDIKSAEDYFLKMISVYDEIGFDELTYPSRFMDVYSENKINNNKILKFYREVSDYYQ